MEARELLRAVVAVDVILASGLSDQVQEEEEEGDDDQKEDLELVEVAVQIDSFVLELVIEKRGLFGQGSLM